MYSKAIYILMVQDSILSHSCSFPGGRIDPSDVDSTHTALREMEEELGIPSSYADVWGELTPVIGRVQYAQN